MPTPAQNTAAPTGQVAIPVNLGVNLLTILAVISAIGGGFVWGGNIERAIQQNRDAVEHNSKLDEVRAKQNEDFKTEIRAQYRNLDNKIDRLLQQERER